MANSLAGLITILSDNEKLLAEFASVLTEEERCIITLDLQRLSENGVRKEEITARLMRVRDECRSAMERAAAEQGKSERTTLSTVIESAAPADQTQLRLLQRRLMMNAKALERQHEMNRKMLENSIGVIKGSMDLFGRLLGGSDTYGAQGRISRGGQSGSFLRKEL